MRILVIGGSGLIGSHLVAEARARGDEVGFTYRNFPVDGGTALDLADESQTAAVLRDFRPDWVIHSAGWTWVDGCEKDPDRAMRENCAQPVMLARLCRDLGCRFAYISTTYVFDGTAGPYTEEDAPRPINVYARSKWQAEQEIQKVLDGQALVPRVICVWGHEAQQKNFVYQVLKALNEGRTMKLPSDQAGNPTWAGDIASALLSLAASGVSGTWNLAGALENCTRVEWFCAIRDAARAMGLAPASDVPGYEAIPTAVLGQPALRPLHTGARIEKLLGFAPMKLRPPGDMHDLELGGILTHR